MMKFFGLNRPIPLVDGPTLFLIIIASLLFAVLGLFDFGLKQLIGATPAMLVYALTGFSAVWQMLRQNYF